MNYLDLDLSNGNNGFKICCFQLLGDGLKNLSNLTSLKLNLDCNNLGDKDSENMKNLFIGFDKLTKLKSFFINLGGNSLGLESIEHL